MENLGYQLEELVPIVAELTPKYAGFEHSSITYEKAQMLMEGVLYCIHECIADNSHGFLAKELPAKEAYTLGQEIVAKKVQALQALSNRLIFNFRDYGLECLKDVITKGLPAFLTNYDSKYTPQETLLTLDYPIFQDISALSGVDAVLAYAKCLELEQQFLGKFDTEYVIEVLRTYHADYELLMENICHIVLANLVAHFMMNKPISSNKFCTEDFENAANILSGKSAQETERYVANILKQLIAHFYEGNDLLKEYLNSDIPNIATRIRLRLSR